MKNQFPGGEWPTMLTPFRDGAVDYPALDALIEWYIANGVSGLFAVCQSSEMFYLSLEERTSVARFVKEKAAGRVPVIASGHISDSLEDQAAELNEMARTGVDAVILITNRMAQEGESADKWIANLEKLMEALPADLPLGLYECPYPYKWVLGEKELDFCVRSGRFHFLKDTCCDFARIQSRLKGIEGSELKLFNANTSTLLDSLRAGAAGFSGVMANFHPELYVWLCENYDKEPEKAETLQSFLTLASQIEKQLYPVNAKVYLAGEGLPVTATTRVKNPQQMSPLYRTEIEHLRILTRFVKEQLRID